MTEDIKRFTLEELEKMKSESDLEKIKNTTEKDIIERSLADPDTPILTKEELNEMQLASERKNGKENN
ncbi:MAG TPA: hypothetical protein ENK04_00210 [Gammaproteobacteria bacterium]|nr:hypothetical protein [Gammaproteobacteria bacterium]